MAKLTEGNKKILNDLIVRFISHQDMRVIRIYDYIEQLLTETEHRVSQELLEQFDKKLKENAEKVRREAERKAVFTQEELDVMIKHIKPAVWLVNDYAVVGVGSADEKQRILDTATREESHRIELLKRILKRLEQLRQDDKSEQLTSTDKAE